MTHNFRNWIIEKVTTYPKRTVFITLALTAFFGSGLQWVYFDDDMLKMLPEDIESRIVWDEVQDDFGTIDMMFVTFGKRGESAINKELLATVWDLTNELEMIEDVEEVISIAGTNRMENEDGFMEISDLMPHRDLSQQEVNEIADYLDRNPSIRDRLLSKHGDFINVVLRPTLTMEYAGLANNVKTIADSLLSDYEINYGGAPYVTGMLSGLIQKDMLVLMRVGLIIMIAILLVNFRNIPAVGMVLSLIILSLVAMMGFMGWVVHFTGSPKFYMTLLNSSMPIILLTIANQDSIHIVTKFLREARKHRDVEKSVKITMRSLMLPVFLTSVTTAVAFLMLTTAPIGPMFGYGITIAFGIVWAWFLSVTYLPAIISVKKWNMNSRAMTHASFFERVVDWFSKSVLNRPKKVLSLGLLIVLVSAFGIMRLKVEVNITSFFKPGNPIRQSIEFIDAEMTGTMNMVIKTEGEIKDPETLALIEDVQTHIEKYPKVNTTISIVDIVKQMHRVVEDDDPAFETIPEMREKVNNLFTMYSMSGDPDDFSSLVDYEYRSAVTTAMMQTVPTSEIVKFMDYVDDYVEKNVTESVTMKITGLMAIMNDFTRLLVQSFIISMIASIFAIFIIAWIFYRSIKWGILAVVPLSSAVVLNFGLMGYFGVDLSHITAILSAIIIGVGVDFAIHYIAQFRNYAKEGVALEKLSVEVVDDVGYPIMLDATANMSFGALIFSTFLPLQFMGGLMVFAMISCSIGTLTILAALVEIFKEKLVEEK
ncbi:MAG: RND family transporter [Candidatus Marinimicrobia bacterium]|nr:RND family transporter [Candidatus Neomarinimicrobiota bacterium]